MNDDEKDNVLAKPEMSWDECECEHERDDHARIDGETFCQVETEGGGRCSCPSFKKASQ